MAASDIPELTDGEILSAVLAGDADRYAVIVKRYRRALLNLAYSYLGDSQSAEDAVQEAFLNSFKWLHTYDSRYSFRTWLWRILLNVCHRIREKGKKLPVTSTKLQAGHSDESPSPLETEVPCQVLSGLIDRERRGQVLKLLDKLTPIQAEAIRLRFFGEMKFQEIADAQGIGLPAAKARVRNGLLQLAKLIQNTCQELSEEHVR
ncbi:ECF RNA polymerase sigma factor SigW [Bremerella volcania]|uniref:ECF RNA polymerase sigma factor SigW n=1 Tax=Bremerella volcania TaxID=2527984 RepID=A0A518CFR0_9BACT|nr:RNA polymerase sigma factor [Bremerella volcania]QDU78056.1 ECF RNA polymerase sigma factor SigW [Bremerella volcania]